MHDLDGLPTEWTRYVHVDGKPYFRHALWGVVTEACIHDSAIRARLETWYHQVKYARSTKKPQLVVSESLELYLTLDPEPAYYFVEHKNLSVFWLDDLPLQKLGIYSDIPTNFGK